MAVLILQITVYSKFLLPLYVIVGVAVFMLSLRLLHAVNEDDIGLLSSFLGPRTEFLANLLGKVLGIRPPKVG